MYLNSANINQVWASLIVEELVRCGAEFFCLAPGSRSTPLAAAISVNTGARSMVHYDERGTAFAALGYARATGRPAVWVTTSGTAVANGLPAVAEAATEGVPLLLLTADRPPELRDTGANQTVEQPGIFGEYVEWSFDLPAPTTDIPPAMVLTTVDQLVYRSRSPRGGPSHLNCMFREPLSPQDDGEDYTPYLSPVGWWIQQEDPYTIYISPHTVADGNPVEALYDRLSDAARPLVVAGRLQSRRHGEAVVSMAEALGWPLLADIGSQVRLGNASASLVPYYDALLSNPDFVSSHIPDAVLQIGGRPVSKRLANLLSIPSINTFALADEIPDRLDPSHRLTHRIQADVSQLCNFITDLAHSRPPGIEEGWLRGWREASQRIERRIEDRGSGAGGLGEPFVARAISELIPEGYGLVVASSMPVRDLDTFARSSGAPVPVASNRGASGIDGTVATAAGFAKGLAAPVTVLIGDLAMLHDINSLAMLRELSVTVVVVNNDGGGIFSFLPVAGHGEFFERYFGTPHGITFEQAAGMFGLGYEAPSTMAGFAEVYRRACSSGGASIIEVRTDRGENLRLHRELLEGEYYGG